jgi:3-dehydroquinate synthase
MKKLFKCQLDNSSSELFLISSLEQLRNREDAVWVCDENSAYLIPQNIEPLILKAGEEYKRWSSVEKIVDYALKKLASRDSFFIAVGGGVVCDMVGFASSIYMRGAKLALIPTTLLAMVDASLGGKCAIDMYNLKNIVGTFYPAQEVHLLIPSLTTLSDKEYKNGLGEVIKHALLSKDDTITQFLEKNSEKILNKDMEIVEKMIIDSLLVKKSFIEADPKETKGIREALNFGHTFAHALESMGSLSTYSHGEAVAWGMGKALDAGVLLNITSKELALRYKNILKMYGFNLEIEITDKNLFLNSLKHDKKKRSSKLKFVLLEKQGTVTLKELDENLIEQLIVKNF